MNESIYCSAASQNVVTFINLECYIFNIWSLIPYSLTHS